MDNNWTDVRKTILDNAFDFCPAFLHMSSLLKLNLLSILKYPMGIPFSARDFRAGAQKDIIVNFQEQFSVINMYVNGEFWLCLRKNHLKPLYLLGICNNLFIFDQYNFLLLTNYLKALVLRFSRTFNCLRHFFRLRSNGNSFLSFWIEVHINIFVLRDFANLLHFYFLNICFSDLAFS